MKPDLYDAEETTTLQAVSDDELIQQVTAEADLAAARALDELVRRRHPQVATLAQVVLAEHGSDAVLAAAAVEALYAADRTGAMAVFDDLIERGHPLVLGSVMDLLAEDLAHTRQDYQAMAAVRQIKTRLATLAANERAWLDDRLDFFTETFGGIDQEAPFLTSTVS